MSQYGSWLDGDDASLCEIFRDIRKVSYLFEGKSIDIKIVRKPATEGYLYKGTGPDDPLGGYVYPSRAFTAWKVTWEDDGERGFE